MNVFVTGGSGFVGREVLRHLARAGHRVRVLLRGRAPGSRAPLPEGAEVYPGDVLEPASLECGLSGIEAVIHLVGIISECGKRVTFENLHTQAARNMVAAARAAGVKRFIHMSALGTRPGAVSRYHQTKWAAEEFVRGSGLDHTIFRPSLIYGPEDHFVNLFAGMSRFSPVLPVMGSGQARFQPVPVEAVARAFVGALSQPASVGKTLDLCGPDTLTLPEILQRILSVTGRTRFRMRVPLGLARLQAAVLEKVYPAVLGKPPPLNRDQLVMLEEDNVGDGRPAADLFGLEMPRFKDGIAAYLAPR